MANLVDKIKRVNTNINADNIFLITTYSKAIGQKLKEWADIM
jgi:hypothetical protein